MELTNISISALGFDNRPFMRCLTATIMNAAVTPPVKATGTNPIIWSFGSQENIYAHKPNGETYITNTTGTVNDIGTLYVYFSATPYNYKTEVYSLCTLDIRATHLSTDNTAQYLLNYDTFPNINLSLYVNYENTSRDPVFNVLNSPNLYVDHNSNGTIFYRLTSQSTPYTANILLSSTSYVLATALSSSGHQTWFTVNNSTTRVQNSTGVYTFIRTIPALSTVQAYFSAYNPPGSLSSWFTPHTIKKELSARFIPEFPTANFIAYPSAYFVDAYTYDFLVPGSISTTSPGVCFYGEGHTENILLCAQNVGNHDYVWRVDNSLGGNYPIIESNEIIITESNNNTAYAVIRSEQGSYPTIPISLLVSNSYILSTSPAYYFDDTTGQPLFYPFYTSTLDLSSKEATSNTHLKQSIRVAPYAAEYFIKFDPGAQPTIYLPLFGAKRDFVASWEVFLNNPAALSACYDKHDTIWKWTTVSNCTAFEFAGVTFWPYSPSSWATVACSGEFPKRWRREGVDDADVNVPITCTLSGIVWTLSAFTPVKKWTDLPTIIDTGIFTYSLQLSEFGGELDETTTGFTVSKFSDTYITLNAKQTAFCVISARSVVGFPNLSVGDWQIKTTVLEKTFNITSIEPYKLKVYVPNKYVLTNTPVYIENLFERVVPSVTAVDALLDDIQGETITLTGDDISNTTFTVTYSTVGGKTVSFTGYSQYYSDVYTETYPELFRVFETYDVVNPEGYYSYDRILLDLPWKEQPSVGANDWVVSDNINSCIKKFNDNLSYLDKRNNTYSTTFNEYYGWLGSEPTVVQDITSCPILTWDDTDCTNPDNIYALTWSDVMLGGIIPEVTETGAYASCGTWLQQTCPLSSVVPNCLGKHCLEWKWISRKSENSTALVTWNDAKFTGKYAKVWYHPLQECETVKNINCDEGVWNVNIPGLDRFYDPIPECYSQNRCTYTSIASYNNILYMAQSTQIKLLSSNRTATFFDLRTTYNDATPFVDIKSIALDSQQRIYVLDGTLSQVAVYEYKQEAPGERWVLFTTFGGIGGSLAKTKFLNPTELHVDQFDNIWVVDTGNFVIKQFTYTGSWLMTLRDEEHFKKYPPKSVCVDSQTNVHVLTEKSIRVYTYKGNFLFEYTPGSATTPFTNARKINTNFNREIIYVVSKNGVIRHFRNGFYSGTIIDNKQCVDNINDIYHDEYRNLLIVNDDKVLKYIDTMTIVPLKGPLPTQYWSLNDLLIDEEEYVQNWVYTKALHRLWDNIEIFRNTLIYSDTGFCKRYKPPIHSKDKITIGQNEIVTSTVINRSLKYLWENFQVLMEYYKTNC
jgi:hypothetical protein